jgi:hypothetical protein
MIDVMRHRLAVVLATAVLTLFGCVDLPPEPLQVDHGTLTVDNHTAGDWNNVEIWINQYYRVAVPAIAAHSRFQVRLDSFVSGYSQRFDIRHAQIKDLRLTATGPDGTPVLVKKENLSGLDALGAKGKQ